MSWKCKICQISETSDIVRLKGLFCKEKRERKEANEEMSDNVEVNPFWGWSFRKFREKSCSIARVNT